MDATTLKQVAWIGENYIQGPVKGVVLSFHGLGATGLKHEPTTVELGWAQAGGLVVYPYYGPWSWMNRTARAFVDDVVDSVYEQYGLKDEMPLASTGGSMGGLSALLYTRYAKRRIKGCLAAYPVCDLEYHFSERPDLPPSILYAFRGYAEDRATLFAENSPLAQVEHMPGIPYLVIHGDKDNGVSKAKHSDRFVAAMRQRGLKVDYLEVPGMTHGGCVPVEVLERQVRFVSGLLG